MVSMQRANGKVKKSYVIKESLADKVSYEAIRRRKWERDVVEDALAFYFAYKDDLKPIVKSL